MFQKNPIIRPALVTAALLLIPLVAMQFDNGVDWSPFDFLVAGLLLFGTGLAYELVSRKMTGVVYRAAVGLALFTTLVLIWANLAVGLIGSENNPANQMYVGVIVVELIGVCLARFRAGGMAIALFATALAQALVAVIALLAGEQFKPGITVPEIININAFFVALFAGAALLFRHAAAGSSVRQTSSVRS